MRSDEAKNVVVVGGPNGAGKTTWVVQRLPPALKIREFVNADEIARGISPLDPEGNAVAAGLVMIERLNELISTGHSFAFETTCSGRGHITRLRRCREANYRITLVFLWLPSVDIALARVARRVSEGGHRIPDDVVVRRYSAGLRNMRHLYMPLADSAFIYDNSDGEGVLVVERHGNEPNMIHDSGRWNQIEKATQ
jgi:predicted ABC-type ATPase